MQSGYGGVSEFQQFIMDGGFAMSAPAPQQHQPGQPPAGQELGGPFRYQPLHHHAHAMPPHFAHFAAAPPPPPAGIPFTQQLLHQAQAAAAAGHQLQLFHEQQHHKPQQPVPARWAPQHHHQQQQAQGHHHQNQHHHLGFDVEAVPESSGAAGAGSAGSGGAAPPGVPSFLAAAMNFKLAVDAGGGSGATDGGGGAGSGMMLHVGGGGGGDEEAATESRLRRWAGDEETSIKEPSWRPLDIDYLHSASSSKRLPGKEKVATPESPAPPTNYFSKKGGDDNAAAAAVAAAAGGNYKLFSELEAICKPGSSGCAQTGSGSGLTGDDNANILDPPPGMGDLPGVADAPQLNTSETSAGEEPAAAAAVQPPQQQRKRKRRRQEHQVSASASFFERLVQRLMEHQESLHRQFLDAMERRERERAARDEAWRRQEADKFAREAAARAQDRASAAAREQAIVTYLEKISGETILLPPPAGDDDTTAGKELVPYEPSQQQQLTIMSGGGGSRWPKQEVEALIRVRTGLEGRFQEPGLKGPLWEEVSSRMAAAGYGRSAKRCKEKWENINKYFRKAKESGKKRPKHAKTCPYFDDLDKLYSRTNANADASNSSKPGSELLDAVVVKYPADAHAVPPGFSAAADGDDDGDGKGRAAADDHHDQDQDDEVSESHAHDDDE
ncbi:unnamed protein product [Urochloa decumbens]|uniref:Myb-like domain-containing protein n=1 Tax=Urochloa decumbens TaxID=240449 RepID=A0ABC9GYJ2_9POAL